MALTNIEISKAKSTAKSYKLSDGGGLYLLVTPAGGKSWRLKYRFLGKEKTLTIGQYPHISLLDAREARGAAKKLLANKQDPGEIKQSDKRTAKLEAANTFELIAREWHEKFKVKWVKKNAARNLSLLENHVFPFIGKSPITQIRSSELLSAIQKIEARGNYETAHRTLQVCGQVFRYAISTDRASTDLSVVLKGALTPAVSKHHASLVDPKEFKGLLRAIDVYEGAYLTKQALKLAPLVFVRPGELRQAEWEEIDFDKKEWRIGAHKMKMRVVHIVPLSEQALNILQEMRAIARNSNFVFPSITSNKRPMSDNTLNMALRRMGFDKSQMTAHGFRSIASTLLHEEGWLHDAIERQLAHGKRDKVSGAYDYSQYLPMRMKMMQHWADYLDALKSSSNVVPLGRVA